jgi:hypothetical protein
VTYANEPTQVLTPPGSAHAAGTLLLGRYRLTKLIGSGGTADVWVARDEPHDQMVTIKLLRDRTDAAARQRFLDEGLWLETIEHKGIVRALGRHDVLGLTLIVFEYIEGTTLAARLASGPISSREAASIVRQLASALEALHSHGVLHLDLKPANIMVGPDGRVRLIDFGIADLIGNTREVSLGTPGYAAPEVRDGRTPTRATDVYGLALIARELLGDLTRDPRVALVLRFGTFESPSRRPSSAARFAFALSVAILFHDAMKRFDQSRARGALSGLGPSRIARTRAFSRLSSSRALAGLRSVRASLRLAFPWSGSAAVRTVGRRAAYAGVAMVLIAVALALPRIASSVAGVETPGTAAPARAYALPPLSAYAARFEWQAPYPTAVAETQVDWVVALRNTGSADWFSDRPGARALLILEDGTVVGTQSSDHVAPGEVTVFHARFIAPATPGVHTVPFRLYIEGTGMAPDLGVYANVTVTARRSPTGGRH